jgi:acyl carrier protein
MNPLLTQMLGESASVEIQASSTLARRASAEEEGSVTGRVRALIAEHLEIDIESVTADTHFTNDLGFDRLDIVELIIMIEDQFGDVETSDEAGRIEFVGDLIRQIEMVGPQDSKRGATGYATEPTGRCPSSRH